MTESEMEMVAAISSQLDETSDPTTPFETATRVLERVVQFVREFGCQYAGQVEPVTRQLFNSYIRPIDIPGVPNLYVEPRFDDALEEALVRAAKLIVDQLCTEDTETKIGV